jgi:hypothetical protein
MWLLPPRSHKEKTMTTLTILSIYAAATKLCMPLLALAIVWGIVIACLREQKEQIISVGVIPAEIGALYGLFLTVAAILGVMNPGDYLLIFLGFPLIGAVVAAVGSTVGFFTIRAFRSPNS